MLQAFLLREFAAFLLQDVAFSGEFVVSAGDGVVAAGEFVEGDEVGLVGVEEAGSLLLRVAESSFESL